MPCSRRSTRERSETHTGKKSTPGSTSRDLVLVTVHRRENHGAGWTAFAPPSLNWPTEFTSTAFVLPVHLNPQVQEVVRSRLAGIDNLRLTPPLAYPEFVWLMERSKLIVSDSGGVQEEAPSLRRPVVALREATERQRSGRGRGRDVRRQSHPERIVEATVSTLLTDHRAYAAMQIEQSPFGDGHAAERIVEWMLETVNEILC